MTIRTWNQTIRYQPGQIVPENGIYRLVTEKGQETDYEIFTLHQGDRFPDIQETRLAYQRID